MKTYGKITAEDLLVQPQRPVWRIECRPHVMLRLKRVFERIGKASHGYANLNRTPENARELLWFIERYPMVVSADDMREMRRLEKVDLDRERAIDAVRLGDYKPTSLEMALPPRDYQRETIEIAIRTGRVLCADELGLGKTITGIGALLGAGGLPALVVTQAHLQTQWRDQIAKFAPQLRTHIVKKGTPYDITKGPRGVTAPFPDVLVMSYSKLGGWADELRGKMRSVIFDEAQELRHCEDGRGNVTNKYAGAKYIADGAGRRIGLTATPIFNYGGEMFNVMDVLAPGALGEKQEFGREWCRSGFGDKASIAEPEAFAAYLREAGLMIRHTRKEVKRELPGGGRPRGVVHMVEADINEIDKLAGDAAELARIILSKGTGLQKMQAGGELDWRLRHATGVAKAPYVAEFVRLLLDSEQKVVLFGWHHDVYSIWMEKLRDFNPMLYTGKESTTQKDRARAEFLRTTYGSSRVLIMSLRSGAGLDGLQEVCRTPVFGELDWSPAVHDQCVGRLYRDGQFDVVMPYFVLCNNGADPIMADVIGVKRDQVDGVTLNPEERDADGAPLAVAIDPHHIQRLARSFLEQRGISVPTEEPEEKVA